MTVKLFRQNPKVEKYKPSPMTRSVLSFDLDRKNELNRFGKWLEFVSEEKSDYPKEHEFKELDKSIKTANPKGFNLMGIVKMLPMAGLALGALGTLGLGTLSVGGGILGSAIGGIGAAITGAVGLGALGLKGIVKLAKPFVMKPLRFAFGGLKKFALRIPGVRSLVNNLSRRGGQMGLKGLIAKLSPKALTRLAGFLGKNVLLKFIKKIPLIGPLIDFAVRYWIFKEPPQKALFISAAAALGGVLLGTIGSLAGPLGTLAGGLIGQIAGDALGEWIYGAFFDSPEVTSAPAPEEIGTNIENLSSATTENPGVQRTGAQSQQTQQAQVTTGNVVQWLHGNPNRPGYDLGHAGNNAHDHFSFSSRGAAVAAYKALRAAGYKPTEFEGFGKYKTSGMRPGSHSPTGGHFGPVDGTPTYDDVTDGVAFDIPWSTYGSGPITQKDYDLSYRAAQIVGAVKSNNVMGTPGQGMLVSNPDSSRTTESQKMAENPMPENPFEAMATMFGFGPNATTAAQPAPPAPKEVAMFTPEAEMANADNVVVINQGGQQGSERIVPFPIGSGGQGGGQDIAVGGDVSLNSMYDELVLTKLALT